MDKNHEHTTAEVLPVSERIGAFLLRHRKVLLIALISVLAGVLAVTAGMYIVSVQAEKRAAAVYDLLEQLKKDTVKDDDEKIQGIFAELKSTAGAAGYPAYQAYIAAASYYFEKEEWEKAYDEYAAAAKAVPEAYTAGVSYFNAAVCAEKLEKPEDALSLYEKAAGIEAFPLKQRAAFNAARLIELVQGKDEAIAAFTKIYEDTPESEWGKLAQSRLLTLTVKK